MSFSLEGIVSYYLTHYLLVTVALLTLVFAITDKWKNLFLYHKSRKIFLELISENSTIWSIFTLALLSPLSKSNMRKSLVMAIIPFLIFIPWIIIPTLKSINSYLPFFVFLIVDFIAVFLLILMLTKISKKVTDKVIETALITWLSVVISELKIDKTGTFNINEMVQQIAEKISPDDAFAYRTLQYTSVNMIFSWLLYSIESLIFLPMGSPFSLNISVWPYSYTWFLIPVVVLIYYYLQSFRRNLVYGVQNNIFKKSFISGRIETQIFSPSYPFGLSGKIVGIGQKLVITYKKKGKEYIMEIGWSDLKHFSIEKADRKLSVETIINEIKKLLEKEMNNSKTTKKEIQTQQLAITDNKDKEISSTS